MDAASLRNYWKICNLATANVIKMKFTTIVYLHENFHLAKDWGVRGRDQKTSEKKPKNCFFYLIS